MPSCVSLFGCLNISKKKEERCVKTHVTVFISGFRISRQGDKKIYLLIRLTTKKEECEMNGETPEKQQKKAGRLYNTNIGIIIFTFINKQENGDIS